MLPISPEDHARVGAAAKALSPDDQSLNASGLRGVTMSHPDWIRESRIRGGLGARWEALFQDVDGTKIPYNDQSVWAGIAILTGLPSTTMPIGQRDGLPIGVQITGGYLEDRTTIGFAALVEREFGGFTPPPNL